MRTLGEIIDAVKDNERPDYEELRWSVLALQALLTFDNQALVDLWRAEDEGRKPVLNSSAKFQFEEAWNRERAAFAKSPKDWVGPSNDPASPDVQQRRVMAFKLLDKALAGTLNKKKTP